ncbi:MAG TPA: hypothetical protein VGX92_19315 [Pyrinomonadaceae bacterium]|nr:hypothetical protein [Pyrinomonadaceae bacterium]
MKRGPIFSVLLVVTAAAAASAYAQSQTQTPQTTSSPSGTRPRIVNVNPPQQQRPLEVVPQRPAAPPASSPSRPQQPTPQPSPSSSPTAPRVIVPSNVPQLSQVSATPAAQATTTLHLSMDKIRLRKTEAQRLLKARATPTSLASPNIYFVTLAALQQDTGKIHLLSLPKELFLSKGAEAAITTSLGSTVRLRVLRANGVNTAVTLFDEAGHSLAPLLVEYPIERGGRFQEMAYYTSGHPSLLSPEVVKAGQLYVRTMIDLAARRLRDKGVTISPDLLDVAERLCVVEHTDHDRFRRENRIALYEEIFALYALNELDTYRYAVSFAGAGGMVQMIPSTYQMIRRMHPGIGLNPDFVYGMRNHGNALEAMLLYMNDTWNLLAANPDVDYALKAKLATQPELLAAGYNSNPARLPGYINRGGASWRTLIPRETQIYLQIYKSLDSLIPMKPRRS